MEFPCEKILHQLSEGIILVSLEGRILFANKAVLKMLSCKKSDILQLQDLLGDPAVTETVLSGTQTKKFRFSYQEKEFFCQTKPFSDNGQILLICTPASLPQEKMMQQITKLNQRLELRNILLRETFGRYLSDNIVKSLLQTRNGLSLGGKKKRVTILMSDIRGFTAMSERMPPKNVLTMLNNYLDQMVNVIRQNGGTIIEFIGDGIMALYGAPVKLENPEEMALRSALQMQNAMTVVNRYNRDNGFPMLEMGIGIHSGTVIVGNIGNDKRTKYGVVGQNVNLCGRIENCSIGGQILISEPTKNNISLPLVIKQQMKIFPKGMKTPVKLFDIIGIEQEILLPDQTANDFREVNKAVEIFFVHRKQVLEHSFLGTVTRLSDKKAVLVTQTELNVFDNIKVVASSFSFFAKVTNKTTASEYEIAITCHCTS